jgi:general nucleoside transport system permease protein
MMESLFVVLVAMLGGAIRVSTPFIFVALGETLTEKSGRINLGLEGSLVFGAMLGYAVSFETGSPWMGVVCAGFGGVFLGLLHGLICSLPRVNDIGVGLAMMSFGTGLAFFFGKPYIQPAAPRLENIPLGEWASSPALRQALEVNPLFIVGILIAIAMWWAFANTRAGLILRMTGDSEPAARAMGVNPARVRIAATAAGGFLAGVGGAFLSLSYPGSWNEGLSSGQGLMAVALVIFARWNPIRCIYASLLFGAAGAIGPALQSVGVSQGYYFFNAAPYILTLFIMVTSARSNTSAREAPGELSIVR